MPAALHEYWLRRVEVSRAAVPVGWNNIHLRAVLSRNFPDKKSRLCQLFEVDGEQGRHCHSRHEHHLHDHDILQGYHGLQRLHSTDRGLDGQCLALDPAVLLAETV